MHGNPLDDIDTPALIVRTSIMKRNLEAMARFARTQGIDLRPHVKTHKCPEIARMQLAKGAVGIAVAKVSEAEVMANSGIIDIQIANEIVTRKKIEKLALLTEQASISVIVDNWSNIDLLSEIMSLRDTTLDILVDIDVGYHRSGLPVNKTEMICKYAKKIDAKPGLHFQGIMTHAGHVYASKGIEQVREIGFHEGRSMVTLANLLQKQMIPCDTVSVGSTPTARFSGTIHGVTEIRAGNYIFNDAIQISFGVATPDNCALRVLSTVTSVPSRSRAIIDAGSKSLGPEKGFAGFKGTKGHGIITGKNAVIKKLTEEHGIIGSMKQGTTFRVGEILEIIPNHACFCVNLHDTILGIPDGKEYGVEARGCSR